jgi:hypothetical protein
MSEGKRSAAVERACTVSISTKHCTIYLQYEYVTSDIINDSCGTLTLWEVTFYTVLIVKNPFWRINATLKWQILGAPFAARVHHYCAK